MVGAALGSKRKQVVLSTKTEARDKAGALAQLDTSLSELKTDFVDIWYLHGKSSPADIHDDMIEALQLAKQQGKARFVGVSTHSNQPQLIPWMVQKGVFDVVLSAFNFSMDPAVEQAIDAAAKAGMGVVAMKVMAGRLAQPEAGAAGRPAGGAEVGDQSSQRRDHHSQHDGHGPVGREPEGHGGPAHGGRPQAAGRASGADPAGVLPHVRPVRRRLREGPAGGRCAALPHLRRRIRRVRAGAGEIFAVGQRADLRALRRLRRVHGEVSPRRAGIGAVWRAPRSCSHEDCASGARSHPAGGGDGARPGLSQLPARARMDTVRANPPVHRRQPLRLQGRRRGGLPDLRLRGHEVAQLQVGREHADHRRLRR